MKKIRKSDIHKSNNKKIDEDFPVPSTHEEKLISSVNNNDSGKSNNHETDESESDGSANAFEGTERMWDDE